MALDPLGLSFWDDVTSIASSTWGAVTAAATSPAFQNTLAVASGAMQIAAGFAIGATTGWTGVGAVAAGALILNGASSLTMGVTNLTTSSSFNTSGFAGAVTSMATENPTANQIASVFDLSTSLLAGGFGITAANNALIASVQPLSTAGYLANFNMGSTAYGNLLLNGSTAYNPGYITNTLTAAGAITSTVNSVNNIINNNGIVAE